MKVLITLILLGVAFAGQPRHTMPANVPAGQATEQITAMQNAAMRGADVQMGEGMNMSGMMPVRSELEFIGGMAAHHQEAVESARVVLEKTERPQLREFAAGVIEVQEREIETLRGWLGAWYPDAPDAPYTPMMRALPGATPDESDRAFIEDMVVHHEGAIDMSRRFLDGKFEKHPETEALAREIIGAQTDEVATLRAWLLEWYGVQGKN